MRDREDSTAQREPRHSEMLSSTDPDTIGRKHPAHGVHIDLGKPTVVFLTVCTKDRYPGSLATRRTISCAKSGARRANGPSAATS